MQKKLLRKVGLLATSIFAMGVYCTIPVTANSLLEDIGVTEINADYATDTSYSLLKGNCLNYGTVDISKLASNKVNVYGATQCHVVCDEVYLDLYLEQKVNGSYSTYKSWEFTGNDVSKLTKSLNVIVPSGYYYRVRGYHIAKDGGARESTSTLTSGILVQ